MVVNKNGLIAALDIGTTKVACFIARVDQSPIAGEKNFIRVVGIGHQIAEGIRGGAIVDVEAAEHSIRAAVDGAERMAGETIRKVVVSLSAGQPASHTVGLEVSIAGHAVNDQDIARIYKQGDISCEEEERQTLHCLPLGYSIDGVQGIQEPRGMFGQRLGVNMHLVTADVGPIRNLVNCIERCHLEVAEVVLAPYASGLASLYEENKDLGSILIEMGGGVTSLGVFSHGALLHTDVIPLGGNHVTNDIARGLSTPLKEAERIKVLYGSAIPGGSDQDAIRVPQIGERDEDCHVISAGVLTGIIAPRIEEIFELIRDRLQATGFDQVAGRSVVLTGGASQLTGVRELAARILDKQVRIGSPIRFTGLPDVTGGPAFATCAGLLSYADNRPAETWFWQQDEEKMRAGGSLRSVSGIGPKISRWLLGRR